MRRLKQALLTILIVLTLSTPALAADGATIIFESGVAVFVRNGYKQIVDSLRRFNKEQKEQYIEINIEGSSFFINLDEVTVICRDQCNSMTIIHPKKR